jgi:hypothetical protein
MSLQFRMNPVTLKELRQMTRSRIVASSLIGFLILQLLCVTFNLLSSRSAFNNGVALSNMALGQGVFGVNYFLLTAVLLFCITPYVGFRMAMERGAEHLDLQFTTALTPRQFVNGKIVSTTILILMFASAALPFMVLSYMLRGIDMFGVLLSFGLLLLMALCSVYAVLLLFSVATSKIFRSLVSLGVIFGLLVAIGIITGFGVNMAASGRGVTFNSTEEWLILGLFILGCISGCTFAHIATVAALSPPHSNREKPLRIWFSVILLIWGAIAFAYFYHEKDLGYLTAWAFIAFSIIAVLLAVSASMAPGTSRRILLDVSPTRATRFFQFPFFTGAENGMAWSLWMGFWCILILQFALGLGISTSNNDMGGVWASITYFLYLVAYIYTVRAFWNFVLRDRLSHLFNGAIAGVLIILGCILPYVLVLGNVHSGHEVAWHFGNVVAVLDDSEFDDAPHLVYAFVWAILALIANTPAILNAFQKFRPPQESNPPQGEPMQ